MVDDNLTNQQVAVAILEKMGVRAESVGSGKGAIERLQREPYDLVLMDVQMPDMNGFEATRAIRDPASKVLEPQVPILAMTAHVMQGDRERCLASGMNDYLSKPIERKALAEALLKWLTAPTVESRASVFEDPGCGTAAPPLTRGSPAAQTFDQAGFVERLGGDVELARVIAGVFLGDIPEQLRVLQSCLESNDVPAVARHAHAIKGAAANVGAEALRGVAAKIEARGREEDLETVRDLVGELQDQFATLSRSMASFAGR